MRFLNRAAVFLVTVYQTIASPQRGVLRFLYKTPFFSLTPGVSAGCRFHPTCSEYAKQSFSRLPFSAALKKSLVRIGRCHNLKPE